MALAASFLLVAAALHLAAFDIAVVKADVLQMEGVPAQGSLRGLRQKEHPHLLAKDNTPPALEPQSMQEQGSLLAKESASQQQEQSEAVQQEQPKEQPHSHLLQKDAAAATSPSEASLQEQQKDQSHGHLLHKDANVATSPGEASQQTQQNEKPYRHLLQKDAKTTSSPSDAPRSGGIIQRIIGAGSARADQPAPHAPRPGLLQRAILAVGRSVGAGAEAGVGSGAAVQADDVDLAAAAAAAAAEEDGAAGAKIGVNLLQRSARLNRGSSRGQEL